MRKNLMQAGMGLVVLGLCVFSGGRALAAKANSFAGDVNKAIQKEVEMRSRFSGTLDLYDEKIGRVRRLRKIEDIPGVKEQDGLLGQETKYRDTVNGDQVNVMFWVSKQDNGYQVKDLEIMDVGQAEFSNSSQEDFEYTDKEIQEAMKGYIDAQSKFTGYLSIFQKETEKMRKLELVELKDEVRRMGILYISRADFRDLDSGDFVGVDVSVKKNKKGELELQAFRIRDVKRP